MIENRTCCLSILDDKALLTVFESAIRQPVVTTAHHPLLVDNQCFLVVVESAHSDALVIECHFLKRYKGSFGRAGDL